MSFVWQVRGKVLSLEKPLVMGIVNVTPDSFSDGGRFFSSDADVFDHVSGMIQAGADIVDVGGESSRPNAAPVSEDDELRRVIPIIQRIAREFPAMTISVDTVKSGVARAALEAGAHIVNDVSGLRFDPGIATVTAKHGAGLVVMHSRGSNVSEIGTYKHATYGDVVTEAIGELTKRIESAKHGGVPAANIAVDPGIGFAKERQHSLAMLAAIPRLVALGHPVMVGVSRKRFIGEITGVREPAGRLSG